MVLWKRWVLACLGATAMGLAGCGGGSDGATVRLLNASSGYENLDLLVDDSYVNSAIAFGSVGSYGEVDTGTLVHDLVETGETLALNSSSRTLGAGTAYTVVAYGWRGGLKTTLLTETEAAADSGKSKLLVLNEAIDAGAVDVYLTGADDSLDSATAQASSVAAGGSYGYTSFTSGTYRLRVTAAGDKSDVRLDVQGLKLASTEVSTLVLASGSGGTLVHGLHLVQKGAVTPLLNSTARVRVVASVAGGGTVTASVGGTALASGATSPTIGSYRTVSAGTAAVSLTVNGVAQTVANLSLGAGSDLTLLVTGSATAPTVSVLTDDNRLPTASTQAKLRLVHGVANLPGALSMTLDYTLLADSVAFASASSFANVTAVSDGLLEVTTPSQTAAVYNSASSTTLAAKGVYTLFMLGDATGTGVRALLRKDR